MSKVKRKQQLRRAEIIETAIRLINNTPFDDLSVADICGAAGISIGSFYHYFDKKSDLLVGLLSLVDEALEETVFPRLTSEDELENLRLLAHGFALHVQQNGLDRSKLISGIEPYDIGLDGQPRSLLVTLEGLFSRAQEKGQLLAAPDAGELARLYLIALRGVSVDWTRHDASYDLVTTMDTFVGLFIAGLPRL